ncbi:MAG: VWA domain-containing protein [Chloroflexi bacterium]|nr:VWA domain-containing protein [Chloroflexota bacterium]
MTFAWPYLLALLLVAPLLLAVHLLLMRRRRRFAVRYASLSLIREALPKRPRWRRHVPLVLFLLSLASLAVAAARPQAVVAVPMSRTSVILALDVSLSMCSTDVAPNRLAVAQEVARSFVKDQPSGTRIGIVAFSGVAQLVVPPTTDRKLLIEAIDGFTAGRGTAVGSALLRALDAIAEVNPDVARTGIDLSASRGIRGAGFEPDIVVLLTDGATTQGVHPIVAAQQAADRRIRVYTIGFGTTDVAPLVCSREQLGSNVFGGRFSGGFSGPPPGTRRSFIVLDEPTLQRVADATGGSYHRAADADQLVSVFRNLPAEVTLQEQHVEVSVAFAALGGLLAAAAVGLSLAWNRYV